jgi:hypothetical protein
MSDDGAAHRLVEDHGLRPHVTPSVDRTTATRDGRVGPA